MMTLYNKSTGEPEIIYAVLDDDHGYPKFLIRKDNQWVYRSAKHYVPKEELWDKIKEECMYKCSVCNVKLKSICDRLTLNDDKL